MEFDKTEYQINFSEQHQSLYDEKMKIQKANK